MTLVDKWRAGLDYLQEDSVTVNLLLTRRCDFECAHCMYMAGPKMPGAYMSNEDLFNVGEFVQQILAEKIRVIINLVGGEPTYDMEEFVRCYRYIRELVDRLSNVSVEMTSNGSWLRSRRLTARLMQVIGPDLEDQSLSLRLSNSEFHDPYRKAEKRLFGERPQPIDVVTVESLWDSDEDVVVQCDCSDCDGVLKQRPSSHNDEDAYQCNKCGAKYSEQWYYDTKDIELTKIPGIPSLHYLDHGIYIDNYHTQASNRTSPVGRAKDKSWAKQDGPCHAFRDVKFTFMPGGRLYDPCCNGGHVKLGHVTDGFLQLFARRYQFMVALHKEYPIAKAVYPATNVGEGVRCANCPKFGADWVIKNLNRVKGKATEFEKRKHACSSELLPTV